MKQTHFFFEYLTINQTVLIFLENFAIFYCTTNWYWYWCFDQKVTISFKLQLYLKNYTNQQIKNIYDLELFNLLLEWFRHYFFIYILLRWSLSCALLKFKSALDLYFLPTGETGSSVLMDISVQDTCLIILWLNVWNMQFTYGCTFISVLISRLHIKNKSSLPHPKF